MVQKIVGLDKDGNKLFERDARAYDKGLAHTMFGITLADLFKAVPVIIACTIFYTNNENFKKTQSDFNSQMMFSASENAKAIGGIKDTLSNLNNYLSSQTGKQFKDGRPY